MTTLNELDPPAWPAPNPDAGLAATCHHLRCKPLDDFTAEDLRVMIGQQIATHILLPLAIHQLQIAPLVSGDCYPGDLFVACTKARNDDDGVRRSIRTIALTLLELQPIDAVVMDAANSMLADSSE